MKNESQEIIEKVLEELKVKAPTFATNVGVAYQRIYDIQRGKTKRISTELGNSIISAYPQFNLSWLLTGEGEMLNKKNNSIVSEPTVSYGEVDSEGGVTAISIIDRNSRSIEKMVEIADRNSRSIQQLVDSNMKLIELLHQNGIIISDETRKGGFYDSKEDKEGQSRNTRTTQAG